VGSSGNASSRRKSGLPPPRSAIASSSWSLSLRSPGRRLGKRLRVVGGERLEPQGECRQRRVALCRDEPVRTGPASRAGQPGIVVELGPQVAEQLGGRVVPSSGRLRRAAASGRRAARRGAARRRRAVAPARTRGRARRPRASTPPRC
jgi:hypothetical protein